MHYTAIVAAVLVLCFFGAGLPGFYLWYLRRQRTDLWDPKVVRKDPFAALYAHVYVVDYTRRQELYKKKTEEEKAKYTNIDFAVEGYRKDLGAPGSLMHGDDKVKTLMARWRYPSLSLHGIQGAFSDPGAKTVIPRKVIGKFSIRIVPDQTPEEVMKLTIDYLERKWSDRKTPNKMKV